MAGEPVFSLKPPSWSSAGPAVVPLGRTVEFTNIGSPVREPVPPEAAGRPLKRLFVYLTPEPVRATSVVRELRKMLLLTAYDAVRKAEPPDESMRVAALSPSAKKRLL